MTFLAATFAAALILQATDSAQEEIRVRAVVAPDSVRIGERITLDVTLSGLPPGAEIVFPLLSDSGPLAALGPPSLLDDSLVGRRAARYELAAWAIGDLAVPAGSVRVATDRAEVVIALPEVGVRVLSVLPDEADPDTLPWRPPSDVVGRNWSTAELLAAASLALALLLGAIAYLRRRGASQPVPVVAGKEPRQRALEELAHLEASGLAESGEMKAFYSALSRILREFIASFGSEWGLDLTTSELRRSLAERGVDAVGVESAGQVLGNADSVKFARLRPGLGQALLDLETARWWIGEFDLRGGEPETEAGEQDVAEEASAEPYALVALEELFDRAEAEGAGTEGREEGPP